MGVLLLALAVLVLDQLTKQAIRANLLYDDKIPVVDGFFNLVYVRNDGAAWNLFSGHGVVLILVSVAVLAALAVYRRAFLQEQLSHRILLGLLVGGIVGNLIDRIRFGWVTDFLDFHLGRYHWPSFNVADSAICIAVGLYILTNFLHEKRKGAESKGPGDE